VFGHLVTDHRQRGKIMNRHTVRYAAGRAVRQTRRNHRAGIRYGGRACSVPGYKITAYVLVIPLMEGRSPFRADTH
jgi:hypothetical protein